MNNGLQVSALTYLKNNRRLFSPVSFSLNPGEGLLLYGANGAGKTTLLKILAGLIKSFEGSMYWQGQNVAGLADLHFIGHQYGFNHHLTVSENILYSQHLQGTPGIATQVTTLLENAQLHHYSNTLAQHLSAGQKRRLALARLLVSKKLWLLDEPFINLDQAGVAWLNRLIAEHIEAQGMIILAAHHYLSNQEKFAFKTLSLESSAEEATYV